MVAIRLKMVIMRRKKEAGSRGNLGFATVVDRETGPVVRTTTLNRTSCTEKVSPGRPAEPRVERV